MPGRLDKMSYFLFGKIETVEDKNVMYDLKEYGKKKDIYIWFNKEVNFYKDIQRMLIEQKSEGNIIFAITSVNQPRNSSDVLFPFDKFTNESLFEDNTRGYYRECCRNNLDIVFDCLEKMIYSHKLKMMYQLLRAYII